jgi:AraC-like DNA-binding protein
MTIWNIIILAAMTQGVLLSLFLVASNTGKRIANIFLAVLILFYSIDIGLETLYASEKIWEYPHLIGLIDPIFYLYGPLLFLYAYALTSPKSISLKKVFVHFLPFLIVLIAYFPLLFLQSVDYKLISEGKGENVIKPFFLEYDIRGYVELLGGFHQLIYFVFTLLLLGKHTTAIKDSFSGIERINLSWLRNLTLATGIIVAIDIVLFFVIKSDLVLFENAVVFISVLLALLIYAIGYMGLKQPLIFSQVTQPESNETTPKEPLIEEKREKYQKSTLTDEQSEAHLARLLNLMKTEKLYLEGELKLSEVAEKLGISTNNLSQIINEKSGKNFYDFVNEYRVETAKSLLLNPKKQHLTLLAIAFESGFNSKSSFNNVFKKQCSLTPSEFKKINLEK